jgi:hypothetical protein
MSCTQNQTTHPAPMKAFVRLAHALWHCGFKSVSKDSAEDLWIMCQAATVGALHAHGCATMTKGDVATSPLVIVRHGHGGWTWNHGS